MAEKIDIIAENLAELLTNTVDMTAVFYDIFLNPHPMDVELKMFNNENELITVVIPNRAKDRVTSYLGEGSPEGVVAAPMGSTYIDTLTSTVYYKVSGSDENGWNAVLSQALMEIFIRTYLEARGYVNYASLNNYLDTNNYVTTNDIASGGSYGVVRLDNTTIIQNDFDQISSIATTNSNDVSTQDAYRLWVGDEEAYKTLYLNGEMDAGTIYILEDNGQIIIGDTKVAGNAFPSSMREDLSLGVSGESYTAPVDGWFLLEKVAGVANANLKITNDMSGYTSSMFIPSNTASGVVVCPALKGETVTITYTASGATNRFVFINAASNRVLYSE